MTTARPLITSGPAGTGIAALLRREGHAVEPTEIPRAIIERRDLCEELCQAHAAAGADIILAPTLTANRLSPEVATDAEQERLNLQLHAIAANAAAEYGVATGAMLSLHIPPGVKVLEAAHILTLQARTLIAAGTELLLLETLISTEEAVVLTESVLEAAEREGCCPKIHISLTPSAAMTLADGTPLAECARQLLSYRPDSIGINCVYPAQTAIHATGLLLEATPAAVSLRPSTALPGHADITPEALAEALTPLLRNPRTALAGACCGGTPEHTLHLKNNI